MKLTSFIQRIDGAIAALESIRSAEAKGYINSVNGLLSRISGLSRVIKIGDRLCIYFPNGKMNLSEIVGFDKNDYGEMICFEIDQNLGPGCLVFAALPARAAGLAVSANWIGRVIDPLGRPLDKAGPLLLAHEQANLHSPPPPAAGRARLGRRLDLGVRAMNLFTTCREGQRLGLFAAAGVGKSTLLAMLARNTRADVVVLGLVGERGREVREFLEDELGADGLARSVVVAATSDTSPLMRREAAYAATAIAEYFRAKGQHVLLLVDSVTRFCLAVREICLSVGQTPVTRGYPPNVFAELANLLERSGPGVEHNLDGHITALFTVLVEGDDINEPISDSVRGIMDGHIILNRKIAERGRFPAIDILRSISRTVPGCNTDTENALARRARSLLSTYEDMADLVRLGAYQKGSNKIVDEAIDSAPAIESLINQRRTEKSDIHEDFKQLDIILNHHPN